MKNGPIRIELPTRFEMGSVNAYLFKDPEPLLIDCGENSDETWEALTAGLHDNGLSIRDIKKLYITHAHVDHMGMANRVIKHSGARCCVSEYVYDWAIHLEEMNDRRWMVIDKQLTWLMGNDNSLVHKGFANIFNNFKPYWQAIPKEHIDIFPIGDHLNLGGRDWEVKYAPGHCINQTVFYNNETSELISADMLLRITPTPVIDAGLEAPYDRAGGLTEMVNTLRQFNEYELSTVYPGHYDIFEDGNKKIDQQLSRIEMRIAQTFDVIKSGNHHFLDILNQVYKNRVSGPAIPMMIGYLDVLLERGLISEQDSSKGAKFIIV